MHLRLGLLFALLDLPIMPRHKIDLYQDYIDGDRLHLLAIFCAVFQHLNKRPPKMTYISALGA